MGPGAWGVACVADRSPHHLRRCPFAAQVCHCASARACACAYKYMRAHMCEGLSMQARLISESSW